jgi:hypothetical protein
MFFCNCSGISGVSSSMICLSVVITASFSVLNAKVLVFEATRNNKVAKKPINALLMRLFFSMFQSLPNPAYIMSIFDFLKMITQQKYMK